MPESSLTSIFERIQEAQHEGVSGVIRVASGVPGPTLGVTVCTHGNEPSGLAVVEYLLDQMRVTEFLKKGEIFLVLNNIEATKAYFNARTEEEVWRARYQDLNMNRLPADVLALEAPREYEVARAQELHPIWKQFDVGLDIHSTTEKSDPMIISRGGVFHAELVRGFPIRTLISNIDTVQIGKPAFSFYGRPEAAVFGIEAGQHTDPESFERACICATALLSNLGMVEKKSEVKTREYDEYHVAQPVMFPDLSYEYVRAFKTFDTIAKGELLAAGDGGEVRAPFDGHILMPTSYRGNQKDIREEVGFLSLPVRTHVA